MTNRYQTRSRDSAQPGTSTSNARRPRAVLETSSSESSDDEEGSGLEHSPNASDTEQMDDESENTGVGIEERARQLDRQKHVHDIAHYVVTKGTKMGVAKEVDIRKLLAGGKKHVRDAAINDVRGHLSKLFGFKLVHDTHGQRFFLMNDLEMSADMKPAQIRATVRPEDENDTAFKDGILISALMYIFMRKRHNVPDEQGIEQEALKKYLQEVGTIHDELFASLFGPVKTAEYLAQGWITRVISGDGAETHYDWGPRAEHVVSKKKIFEMFLKIHGSKIDDWPQHAIKAGLKKR